MQISKIRFLEKGEQVLLPRRASVLPKKLRTAYMEKRCFYRREGDTVILQTTAENSMTAIWRQNGKKLLEQLKKEGISIVIPPLEGELPSGILPFAEGRRLTNLFAFIGGAEALKRQGKDPAACRYLLAGGREGDWRMALTSMGKDVNHLAIFTADVREGKKLEQELFAEYGLMTEVFASPKNPSFGQADVVFGCGMEQRKYEHMLKEGAVWIDLAGNRPLRKRLREARPDVVVCDGFFFRKGKRQLEGREAEAENFQTCPLLRENWQFPPEEMAGKEILCELQEKGYVLSGFSLEGKRVKIRKNP